MAVPAHQVQLSRSRVPCVPPPPLAVDENTHTLTPRARGRCTNRSVRLLVCSRFSSIVCLLFVQSCVDPPPPPAQKSELPDPGEGWSNCRTQPPCEGAGGAGGREFGPGGGAGRQARRTDHRCTAATGKLTYADLAMYATVLNMHMCCLFDWP